jgi:hypothetical protein
MGYSDFHSSKDIKSTRKENLCGQCGSKIPCGSQAKYSFGKYEGETYSVYTHVECADAAREFAELNGLWGEEYPWFQHMEDGDFGHRAWLLEKHPIVAKRLNIVDVREDA